MLTSELQKEIFNFVNARFKYLYPSDCYDEDENTSCCDDYFDELLEKVQAEDIAYGASKIVFWFHEIKGYVIKIPILGQYDYWKEDYVDYSQAIHEDIPMTSTNNDYCGLEADIYHYIATQLPEIKSFFAPTYYIGTTDNGIRVYVAEKVQRTLSNSKYKSVSDNSCNKASLLRDTYGYLGGLSEHCIGLLCDYYSEILIDKLILFIYNFGLDDLHPGNLGYDKNNKIVFIDYSGFFD